MRLSNLLSDRAESFNASMNKTVDSSNSVDMNSMRCKSFLFVPLGRRSRHLLRSPLSRSPPVRCFSQSLRRNRRVSSTIGG